MALKTPSKIGTLLLAIWLVAHGAFILLDVTSAVVHNLIAALAIAAGVFVFLER